MKKVLQKPDLSGRLVNWAVELGQFDIEFHPRTAIKGQVLADFLVEFCNIPEAEELPKESTWVVFVDGSSTRGRSGVRVLLRNPEGQEFGFAVKLDFVTTNNEAEYEAVIAGLALSREMGATNVKILSDSQVVVGQVQGQFEAQEDRMARYLEEVRRFQSYFERFVITKIPLEENIRADEFSKIASGTEEEIEASRRQIIILTEPSIAPRTKVMEADSAPEEPEWARDIIQFLRNGLLPEEKGRGSEGEDTSSTVLPSQGDTVQKRIFRTPAQMPLQGRV
jgi:ribonuclease HI